MTQTSFLDRPGVRVPSAAGSPTSIAGAEHARPYAAGQVARVHEHIRSCGEAGATDAEVAEALGIQRSTICARRNYLMQRGFVVKAGERPGKFGVNNATWRTK